MVVTILFIVSELSVFLGAEVILRLLPGRTMLTRKLAHLAGGLIAVWFIPRVGDLLTITLIALGFTLILLVSSWFRLLHSVHAGENRSIGSIVFALPFPFLWAYSLHFEHEAFFIVPALIYSISDPVAALVGRRFPLRTYRVWGFHKSFGGSMAFFITAAGATTVALSSSGMAVSHSLLVASLLALITALTEGMSVRGIDNLTVPVVAMLGLHLLMLV